MWSRGEDIKVRLVRYKTKCLKEIILINTNYCWKCQLHKKCIIINHYKCVRIKMAKCRIFVKSYFISFSKPKIQCDIYVFRWYYNSKTKYGKSRFSYSRTKVWNALLIQLNNQTVLEFKQIYTFMLFKITMISVL